LGLLERARSLEARDSSPALEPDCMADEIVEVVMAELEGSRSAVRFGGDPNIQEMRPRPGLKMIYATGRNEIRLIFMAWGDYTTLLCICFPGSRGTHAGLGFFIGHWGNPFLMRAGASCARLFEQVHESRARLALIALAD